MSRLARWLLRLLLPKEEREFYLGDLEESGRRSWVRELWGAATLRVTRRHRRGATHPTTSRSPTPMFPHLLSDLRLGARQLVRTPGATLTALLALAIGIGLSGMMFSLIRGGLLPTLPVPNGERVVRVQLEDARMQPELYLYWQERQRSFEGLGAAADMSVSLIIDGVGGEPVFAAAIDLGTLSLLSTRPIMGREFVEADAVPGAPKVALIGYDIWQSRTDADPNVIGRTIRMSGEPATIIGVMPEGFGFPFAHQVWTPLHVETYEPEARDEGLYVYGLLREGVTNAAAAAELNALALERPRAASEPEPPPADVRDYTNIINPAEVTYILGALMVGVALLVLLVACANVTNVLLARAAVRAREVAVRTALGASRTRIAMQFWTEATVLAVAGAVGGAGLAVFGVSAVREAAMAIPGMPFWFDLRVNGAVVLFIAVSAVLAAMVAGVLPALHAAGPDRQDLLKDASRGASSRRLSKLMSRLVGVQLTVSFVLLVASGLFIRSALNLQSYDFGFAPEGVYTANVRLPDATYEGVEDRLSFIEELEERLTTVPGSSSATLATVFPGIGHPRTTMAVEGLHDPTATDLPRVGLARVSPSYFQTFHAPLLAGRAFDRGDRAGALPVAIVNARFERMYLPRGAVGGRVSVPRAAGEEAWHTIVGVVPDFLAPGIDDEHPLEVVYVPLAQNPPLALSLSVRADGDASALATPIREVATDVDADAALFFMRTLDDAIEAANASWIWMSALFMVAGGLALLLAGIGLYGVMAFWVSQRSREIGVRMAVGGGSGRIVGYVVGQGIALIAIGLVAGLLLSVPVGWALRGALLGVSPFDPLVFGSVLGVLLAAGALGSLLPAVSATRVDPNRVLSSE